MPKSMPNVELYALFVHRVDPGGALATTGTLVVTPVAGVEGIAGTLVVDILE